MKKIYFALMLALGTLVASCDMDKEPYGSLNENSAIQSMNDIHRFRKTEPFRELFGLPRGGGTDIRRERPSRGARKYRGGGKAAVIAADIGERIAIADQREHRLEPFIL